MRTIGFEPTTTWNFHITGIRDSTGLNYAPFEITRAWTENRTQVSSAV
tara:strand:- start:786 stop:929 length:144 start_codon:yes stop_codon:yes gene_type:complete